MWTYLSTLSCKRGAILCTGKPNLPEKRSCLFLPSVIPGLKNGVVFFHNDAENRKGCEISSGSALETPFWWVALMGLYRKRFLSVFSSHIDNLNNPIVPRPIRPICHSTTQIISSTAIGFQSHKEFHEISAFEPHSP